MMLFHLSTVLFAATVGRGAVAGAGHGEPARKPIMLDESGGFAVGGKVITDPRNPNNTLSCDHGYVEYFIPWTPRSTSLVMWHSSSTQTFQNRWDGGEGYKDIFLRRDYPVYLWEGPRVGRANWGCEPYTYYPDYRDQVNFLAWNLGPEYMKWWPDVQFPDPNWEYAWDQATRGRYIEFDTAANVQLHTDVAAQAADSGRLGDSIVYIGNSASGLRALLTAIKSKSNNIKALVIYECVGMVFPDDAGIPAGTISDGFGPFLVPPEDFKRLASLEAIQFVWGDHRSAADNAIRVGGGDYTVHLNNSKLASQLINKYGGNSEVLMLGDEEGLHGTTHIAFMDQDNKKVADLMEGFLKKHKLNGYADGRRPTRQGRGSDRHGH